MQAVGLLLSLSALAVGGTGPDPCEPKVVSRTPSRDLPHALYDQAMTSLPAISPSYQLLVGRRSETIGAVEYALLVYRETPTADSVEIMAVAVSRGTPARAWDLEATCPAPRLPEALVTTMELLGNLK